jgi:perosamine synthetase
LPLKFQVEESVAVNSYWMVTVMAEDEFSRDIIRAYLKLHGVETRPVFYPAHTMPAFKQEKTYPVAESLSRRGINLPSYPQLNEQDVANICKLIKNSLDQ